MDLALARYFDALHERRGEALEIAKRSAAFRNGDTPVANDCHANVDRWIIENPGHAAVRGWLIVSDMGLCCMYAAHSVVAAPDGVLFDITPLPSGYTFRFLPHAGSDADFPGSEKRWSNITWPMPM